MVSSQQKRRLVALALPVALLAAIVWAGVADGQEGYRGRLGADSNKVIVRDGKTLLWAGGDPARPDESQWYDFTDAAIAAEALQFGIGKDAIPPINDPLFVKPNDPRLKQIAGSVYRRDERVEKLDDMRVIGYVVDGQARAYPTALLDRHELVNDTIAGKPVTIGW